MTANHHTLFIAILTLATACSAGLRDPFAPGFSMGTQGTVINGDGATGREPWASASLCNGPPGFGFSLSGISYYGPPGGVSGGDAMTQVFGGGSYAGKHCVAKISIADLNALNVYYEQTGFVSVGTDLVPRVRMSVEVTGYRIGVTIPGTVARTIAEAGMSVWAPWSWAAFSFQVEHLAVERGGVDGSESPPALRFGIHTVHNRFGGQGAVVTILPSEPSPVCFTVGEEYRLTSGIAFNAAFSNNPLFISFGVAFQFGASDFSVALVNHERLGWSQGFAAGYYKVRK